MRNKEGDNNIVHITYAIYFVKEFSLLLQKEKKKYTLCNLYNDSQRDIEKERKKSDSDKQTNKISFFLLVFFFLFDYIFVVLVSADTISIVLLLSSSSSSSSLSYRRIHNQSLL